MRAVAHIAIVVLLTILTQLGGIAWLISLAFKRRLLAFLIVYAALSLSATVIVPQFGRVPLPCISNGPLQPQSLIYCALNRHYVTPLLRQTALDLADTMNAKHPDTTTLTLDANFPFGTGFPLLPHLSHNDGRKLDLALYYSKDGSYLPRKTSSPIGYFAFEDGPSSCPPAVPTLRWDLAWLQTLWPNYDLDSARMSDALRLLTNDPRIGKVFIEPHLQTRFGNGSDKLRFQGCRAARHDDHIHIQL